MSLVEEADSDYDIVVFFGSQSDNAAAPDVQSAAEAAFRAAAETSPAATVIAIGPVWGTPAPPGYILTNRDAVGAAAAAAGVRFVDPLAAAWFDGPTAPLGPDSRQPSEAGYRELAERIGPLIDDALPEDR